MAVLAGEVRERYLRDGCSEYGEHSGLLAGRVWGKGSTHSEAVALVRYMSGDRIS